MRLGGEQSEQAELADDASVGRDPAHADVVHALPSVDGRVRLVFMRQAGLRPRSAHAGSARATRAVPGSRRRTTRASRDAEPAARHRLHRGTGRLCRRSRTREIERDKGLSWRSHPRKATVSSISSRSYRGEEASATSIISARSRASGGSHARRAARRPGSSARLREARPARPRPGGDPSRCITDSRTVASRASSTVARDPRRRGACRSPDGSSADPRSRASSSSFSESIRKGESVVFTSRTEAERGVPVAPRLVEDPHRYVRAIAAVHEREGGDDLSGELRRRQCGSVRSEPPGVRAGERLDGRHPLRRHPLGEVTSEARLRSAAVPRTMGRPRPSGHPTQGPNRPNTRRDLRLHPWARDAEDEDGGRRGPPSRKVPGARGPSHARHRVRRARRGAIGGASGPCTALACS